MRFLLIYTIALALVGLGGLDTAERAFAARSITVIDTGQGH